MAFLKDCPETAEGKTAMLRNIDFSTQETQAPSTPEREPAHRDVRADSKRGVAGLEALSHASPQKPLSLREPPKDLATLLARLRALDMIKSPPS